ncbi:MAG: hypothetical protein AB1631_24565 [Acidobacteriota bacterium]
MTASRIFSTKKHKTIERAIVRLLNAQPDFLSAQTAASPRATGDAIQSILSEKFQSLLGDLCVDYSADFARRAMADLAFTDVDRFYYVVDVKTHRLGTHFNMPNLTSVERLTRFYEDDRNYFVTLIVKYEVEQTRAKVKETLFIPIEFLSWECLTIGALGWGQIQIANANFIKVNTGYSRKRWMIELCDVMLEFYPREIGKIKERIKHFEKVKRFWEKKS